MGMNLGVIVVIGQESEYLAVNPDDSEMLNPDASPAENPA